MVDYRFFDESFVPPTEAFPDDSAYTFGIEFRVNDACSLKGMRFYQPETNGNTVDRYATVYQVGNPASLVTPKIFGAIVPGWNEVEFDVPVELTVDTNYYGCVTYLQGRYAVTADFFSTGDGAPSRVVGPVELLDVVDASNGQLAIGVVMEGTPVYPNINTDNHYWIDVIVSVENGGPEVLPMEDNETISDYARRLMLNELGATSPDERTNADLMRDILADEDQTFFDAQNRSPGNALDAFYIQLRNQVGE